VNQRVYRLFPCLAALLLSACIAPQYVGEEPPFEDIIPILIEGQSTRREIVDAIGHPAASYRDGMEWVYTDSQINWKIFALGPWGGTGTDYTGDQHFLVLVFDGKDILISKRLEVAEPDSYRCSDDGICHDGEGHIMRFANPAVEVAAKSFTPLEEQCSVYLFGIPDGKFSVELDGENLGDYSVFYSFFNWNLEPGSHHIIVHPRPVGMTFICQENQLLFVQFKFSFWNPRNSSLEFIDADKGRKQISKRKMKMILPESVPLGAE
jgi:hypothetical protein